MKKLFVDLGGLMIKITDFHKEEFVQCQSCLTASNKTPIKKIQIGANDFQTVTIKLCGECMERLSEEIKIAISNID